MYFRFLGSNLHVISFSNFCTNHSGKESFFAPFGKQKNSQPDISRKLMSKELFYTLEFHHFIRSQKKAFYWTLCKSLDVYIILVRYLVMSFLRKRQFRCWKAKVCKLYIFHQSWSLETSGRRKTEFLITVSSLLMAPRGLIDL